MAGFQVPLATTLDTLARGQACGISLGCRGHQAGVLGPINGKAVVRQGPQPGIKARLRRGQGQRLAESRERATGFAAGTTAGTGDRTRQRHLDLDAAIPQVAREVSNSATSRDLGATSKGSRRKHISLRKKATRADAADGGQRDNEESELEQPVMVPIEEPLHSSTTGSPKNRAGIPTIPGGSLERSGSRASANSHNSHNRTWYKARSSKRERPSL